MSSTPHEGVGRTQKRRHSNSPNESQTLEQTPQSHKASVGTMMGTRARDRRQVGEFFNSERPRLNQEATGSPSS